MKLTKYTHACVRLEDGGNSLVIDPGVFSEAAAALSGADGVLITHEHPDHLDADALRTAAAANPNLRVWAPAGVAASLSDLGERVSVTAPGEQFDAVGFDVTTHGGQHALIHPLVPIVANIAYVINGTVLHPGDSFTVPAVPVQTLLLPLHAPWSKVSEVIDFAVAVRAPQIFQIHDSLLTDTGRAFSEGHVSRIAGSHGLAYRYLGPIESVTL
ncbi:MAG: MBL fold metallo-hydrolase [Jatrophihabitans sp.]